MTVLSWDKPERIMTTEEWSAISADGAPPGVYTPNMSEEDRLRWKAKLVGRRSDHPRVEIRKSLPMCQIKIVTTLHPLPKVPRVTWTKSDYRAEVQISMNGTALMSADDFTDMAAAVAEARQVLASL